MINIKNNVFLLVLIFIAGNISAQQKNISTPFQFHSINNVGLLEGEAGSAFQLQTINGAQYKSWFAGIGVGLDYYRFRTIPLFIDLRKEFGNGVNKFLVYSNAGTNFYWKRDKDPKQFYVDDAFKNGFYGEGGFGYKLSLNHRIFLFFSGGYSYKKLSETGAEYFYGPVTYPATGALLNDKINYNLNRLLLKVGIEF